MRVSPTKEQMDYLTSIGVSVDQEVSESSHSNVKPRVNKSDDQEMALSLSAIRNLFLTLCFSFRFCRKPQSVKRSNI